MSSSSVRLAFKTFVVANIGDEKLVDFSGEFSEIKDLLNFYSVPQKADWTGIDFIPGDEEPITIGANNSVGKYRETGAVNIQVVGPSKLGGWPVILARAEALLNKFRGIHLGLANEISVVSVSTISSNDGAAINFGDGYTTASFYVEYQSDKNL